MITTLENVWGKSLLVQTHLSLNWLSGMCLSRSYFGGWWKSTNTSWMWFVPNFHCKCMKIQTGTYLKCDITSLYVYTQLKYTDQGGPYWQVIDARLCLTLLTPGKTQEFKVLITIWPGISWGALEQRQLYWVSHRLSLTPLAMRSCLGFATYPNRRRN